MNQNYFLHRIQEENNTFSKGIEVHSNLDDAIRSFWGRMKLGYNNSEHPGMTFVSCKITDNNGNVVSPRYNLTWVRGDYTENNKFFMHHIKLEGDSFTKDIDVFDTFDAARMAYAIQMEYGYNNTKFPNIKMIQCEITDKSGSVMDPFRETWIKEEEEPATVEE